jgi:ribosome biogenesis GTPase / thiamine phosphate phosphatase
MPETQPLPPPSPPPPPPLLLALYDIEPDELDGYFREIAPLVAQCQFSDCTHQHEPGCAVRTAVDDGRITFARYDSYLRLREEHEALEQSAY